MVLILIIFSPQVLKVKLTLKKVHDGSKRYNARLVVNGFQLKKGIDYTEIDFSNGEINHN